MLLTFPVMNKDSLVTPPLLNLYEEDWDSEEEYSIDDGEMKYSNCIIMVVFSNTRLVRYIGVDTFNSYISDGFYIPPEVEKLLSSKNKQTSPILFVGAAGNNYDFFRKGSTEHVSMSEFSDDEKTAQLLYGFLKEEELNVPPLSAMICPKIIVKCVQIIGLFDSDLVKGAKWVTTANEHYRLRKRIYLENKRIKENFERGVSPPPLSPVIPIPLSPPPKKKAKKEEEIN